MLRLSLAFAILCCGLVDLAPAQTRRGYQPPTRPRRTYQRYQSSRPALSPYLNYFRQDNGVVTPYQNFIQPYQRTQQFRQQQQSNYSNIRDRLRQQQQEIAENSKENRLLETRTSTLPQTGVGGTYQNYSHFFNLGGSGR